jgi:hypothetical protein
LIEHLLNHVLVPIRPKTTGRSSAFLPEWQSTSRFISSSCGRITHNPPYAVSMTNTQPSRRIVSLQPSVTVILDRLNSLDLLVACTRYCQAVCAEVNDGSRLIVKDSWSSQSSEIVAAQPDLRTTTAEHQCLANPSAKIQQITSGLAPHV